MRKPMLQGVGIVLFFLLGSWELESGFLLENRISFYAFTHLLARNTPTDPSGRFSVFYLHSCPQARDTKIFPTAHVIQLQKGTVFRFQEMIRKKVHFKKGSTLKKKKKKNPGWNFPELKAENQVSLTSICFAAVQRCSFIFCEHKQHNMAFLTVLLRATKVPGSYENQENMEQ